MSIDDKYEIHGLIGKGSFGKIYKGIRLIDGMTVAIKVIEKLKIKQEEISIMKMIEQDCSVKYIEEFDEDENKIIIMTYFNGYNLFDFVSNCFSTSEEYRNKVLLWFKELKDCIYSLHKKGIYHRDIKLENVMLNNNIPKLVDYGLSFYDDGKSDIEIIGSFNYYDKFYITLKQYTREQKIQILRFHDYYCLIVMIYSLLTKRMLTINFEPRENENIGEYKNKFLKKIKQGKNFIFDNSIKLPFMELVRNMINFIQKNDIFNTDFFETVDLFMNIIK